MSLISNIYPNTISLTQILDEINDLIEKEGDKWILWNKEKTKKLGTHNTRSDAIAQELAIRHSQKNDSVEIKGEVLPVSEYEKELSLTELEDLEDLTNNDRSRRNRL